MTLSCHPFRNPAIAAGLLALVVGSTVAPVAAQTRSWDRLRFTPPQGSEARTGSLLFFTTTDPSRGTFCRVGISDSQASLGEPLKDFAAEWGQIVAQRALEMPRTMSQGTTAGGLSYLAAEAPASDGATRYHVRLHAFTVDQRRFSVVFYAPDAAAVAQCAGQNGAFLASLQFGEGRRSAAPAVSSGATPASPGAAAAPATAGAGAAPTAAAGGGAGFRGGGIAGVWMGYRMTWVGPMKPGQLQPHWVVLYDDGLMISNTLPPGGLLNLDREALKRQWASGWGHFTWDGRSGRYHKPGLDPATDVKLSLDGDKLKLNHDRYNRSVDVDGLRLEGGWTSYANPADPQLAALPPGERPVIRFTRDGRFVDEGLLRVSPLGIGVSEPERAPGQGRYQIADFSLVLAYDDGRRRQLGLTGLASADLRHNDSSLFLERLLLRKLP